MYKLLLATDRPEVLDAFGEIRDWERLGFRPPRTAGSADAAEESLRAHHADAVAVALPPEEERKLVEDMGCPHWHLRPIMRAAADRETVLKDVMELELLLSRTQQKSVMLRLQQTRIMPRTLTKQLRLIRTI